ncbi:sulfotransferase [Thioclava sp. JE_KL1]|uniref:sulfotransferase n=1 Tax=Thioclava sp. JE_KL1 TaxID=2651187 RepID=UPI00128D1F16|nr:sulfotransferase [Thioclava sp. JE_KL1]MPQ95494.1 hypothetical protein [Thioclava sp. JE_KL1]
MQDRAASAQPHSLPRVVAIGFNKCGTRSLAELFRAADHPTVHHKIREGRPVPRRIGRVMRENLAAGRKVFASAEDFTFYCDLIYSDGTVTWEGATAFREILRDYPDTILLLNFRDREGWIASRLKHGHGEFAKRELAARGLTDLEVLKDQWRAEWDAHLADVRAYMADKPDQYVEFDLDNDSADDLAARLPAYGLDAADLQDIGRTRGKKMHPLKRLAKKLNAHLRPRFFR